MKLLYRISITTFSIVFATALVLTFYSLSVQKTLITNQLEKKGQVLTSVLATSVMNHLISYDFYTIKLLFDSVKMDNDIVSVSLIGPDRYIKMHSDLAMVGEKSSVLYNDSDFTESPILKKEYLSPTQRHIMFYSPVEIDHNRFALVHISLSDKEYLQMINTFGQRMLFLTAGVLLTAIIAAYLMSRQISNPVIELTDEIKRFIMKRPGYLPGEENTNEITVLERTFRIMMREIQQSIEFRVKNEKMAVLGNLSSVLAHEVKNPLEPIKGSAELLRLKNPGNKDILKYTDIIQSEVSELITFLDSFLDVAKTSSISMKDVNINKTVEDIMILLDYTLEKEQVRADLILSRNIPTVKGNSGMIKQVILNLIINAIQARKGITGLIEISTLQREGSVIILIKDHGTGVEESIRERIFQPFYTTKSDGSGIGLSTSRHIINQHGGIIRLSSEYGAWTEVEVSLPISPEKENENAE